MREARSARFLCHWVIYQHPSDRTEPLVARKWLTGLGDEPYPTDIVIESRDLEQLREQVRKAMADDGIGAVCLPRDPTDDPVILETWV